MAFSIYKPVIFRRSLFNSFAEILLSCTTENKEVPSAKRFTVDIKSSNRSLMQIRKKSEQRMEPCGTPALTGYHSDVWTFSRTFWNLFLKKLSMRLNRESETPIGLSLIISPWFQTLSKALDLDLSLNLKS